MQSGRDIRNHTTSINKENLQNAIIHGDDESFKNQLLGRSYSDILSALINFSNEDGASPLILAIDYGRSRMVGVLLKVMVNSKQEAACEVIVNKIDLNGLSPLMHIAKLRLKNKDDFDYAYKTANLLLTLGADPNKQIQNATYGMNFVDENALTEDDYADDGYGDGYIKGDTALHLALDSWHESDYCTLDMVQLLISNKKTNLTLRNVLFQDVFLRVFFSIEISMLPSAVLLINYLLKPEILARLNPINESFESYFHSFAEIIGDSSTPLLLLKVFKHHYPEAFLKLLNSRDKQGFTPLVSAIEVYLTHDFIEFLILLGANIHELYDANFLADTVKEHEISRNKNGEQQLILQFPGLPSINVEWGTPVSVLEICLLYALTSTPDWGIKEYTRMSHLFISHCAIVTERALKLGRLLAQKNRLFLQNQPEKTAITEENNERLAVLKARDQSKISKIEEIKQQIPDLTQTLNRDANEQDIVSHQRLIDELVSLLDEVKLDLENKQHPHPQRRYELGDRELNIDRAIQAAYQYQTTRPFAGSAFTLHSKKPEVKGKEPDDTNKPGDIREPVISRHHV